MKDTLKKSLIMLFSAGLTINTASPVFAISFSIIQSIDPSSTYIRTSMYDRYPSSPFDKIPLDAIAINLRSLGILPGTTIRLQQLGSFNAFGQLFGQNNELSIGMGGVFSSSNTILSRDLLKRIPGAIYAGTPQVITGLTNLGQLSTDIPEDFRITDTQVQVPLGASFLFVGALDSQFSDNFDLNNDFAVKISNTTPNQIPESNAVGGLLVFGLGFILNKRIRKKSSTCKL